SLRDAVATVIIEAMGAGLPIICLDKTGPAQVLNHQTGVVIQPGNIQKTVDSLASAIILLVLDPSLRQQMGKTAQKTAAKEHTWDARAKAMLKVYSDAGVDVDDN
ncbi:MAG: glycosyltransferase family 4 protein, partial [Desulfobacula sp.]|nr:glycosyltransferase family 4 protein [Desulfobacula sp.]